MNLESLYEDETYNQLLVKLAGQNLLEFDDYRQEVFAWLAEHGGDTRNAAKRIAMRMRRSAMKDYHLSMPEPDAFPYHDTAITEAV